MATYKVLQDIEAEDKLIGPLTLRQCIYAAIAAVAGYLTFLCVSRGAAFMAVFLLPFVGFGVFFAFPWTKDQPTEVWALAKVRFALKPRKRIWDQNGMKHLVTVTVPKMLIDPRSVHRMSESEVRSRLRALAATVDSRGWATKNVPLTMYGQSTVASDRLLSPSPSLAPGINYKESSSDDIFDLENNPLAQQFNAKMNAASVAHRQELIDQVNNPAPQPATGAGQQNYWYGVSPQPVVAPAAAPSTVSAMPGPVDTYMQSSYPSTPTTQASASAASVPPSAQVQPARTPYNPGPLPGQAPAGFFTAAPAAATPTAEDEALAQEIKRRQQIQQEAERSGHMRVVLPLAEQQAQEAAAGTAMTRQAAAAQQMPMQAQPAAAQMPQLTVTAQPNPATLELANNDDLDIATIAREAKRRSGEDPNEVVVSLH